jgi:hypothetical protein
MHADFRVSEHTIEVALAQCKDALEESLACYTITGDTACGPAGCGRAAGLFQERAHLIR